MFKVSYKNARTTSLTSPLLLTSHLVLVLLLMILTSKCQLRIIKIHIYIKKMFKYIKSIQETNTEAVYIALYAGNANAFIVTINTSKLFLHFSYFNPFSEVVLLCEE